MEGKQPRVQRDGAASSTWLRSEEAPPEPLSLGPGGNHALLIIRGMKNTLGPQHPHKVLHKPSGAVVNDKTDGVTEIEVTHRRGHITFKYEAVNNAAPLPTF